jgi:hypothetical protein
LESLVAFCPYYRQDDAHMAGRVEKINKIQAAAIKTEYALLFTGTPESLEMAVYQFVVRTRSSNRGLG